MAHRPEGYLGEAGDGQQGDALLGGAPREGLAACLAGIPEGEVLEGRGERGCREALQGAAQGSRARRLAGGRGLVPAAQGGGGGGTPRSDGQGGGGAGAQGIRPLAEARCEELPSRPAGGVAEAQVGGCAALSGLWMVVGVGLSGASAPRGGGGPRPRRRTASVAPGLVRLGNSGPGGGGGARAGSAIQGCVVACAADVARVGAEQGRAR
mmetsp:Transcript_18470/g.44125  ORF Transcript_18470/g.44125 Transcript_18470/m.44125 type:complete len:210 (+) Transcript_18470:1316-1945(+)